MKINSLFGDPVVYSSHLRDAEKRSIAEGASEETYIWNVGAAVSERIDSILSASKRKKSAILLLGKGNNAADTLATGCCLLDLGFEVYAYPLFPSAILSPLYKIILLRFQQRNPHLLHSEELLFSDAGCIIDGIFGSGYQNKSLGSSIIQIISVANQSKIPIFSIDIPSGLNGDTGIVASVCIRASYTFYLGFPKIGFFIQDGYNYIGELIPIDFGLPKKFVKQLKPFGNLLNEKNIASLLPVIKRNRHKYQSGYALTIGGSIGMEGAGILCAISALKVGAGISRLFSSSVNREMPLEILQSLREKSDILRESKRANVAIIGPGLGMDPYDEYMLQNLLPKLKTPLIMDADGINICARHPLTSFTKRTIFTPHYKELLRLLNQKETCPLPLLQHCQDFVDKHGCVLVYKGAPTWIFFKNLPPLIITRGDPGMATAGSGDILAGMIGGLVAQGLTLYAAAIMGVYIHGMAGEIAAAEKTSYCVIASDIILALPEAFFSIYDKYQATK